MSKIPCASQNMEAKTLPTDASLVTLDGFDLLLFTQLTANLTPKWSGGFMFHCHIFTQKLLFVALKQLQTMLWIIDTLFFIDCEQMQHPLWTRLSHWQMFIQNAFWYLQLLCYLMLFQFLISKNKFLELFDVFWDNCRIWVTWEFSIIPPLSHCFRWSRVWITLIKPLLCLNSIFSHGKAMLYQHTKFRFFHWFKNL